MKILKSKIIMFEKFVLILIFCNKIGFLRSESNVDDNFGSECLIHNAEYRFEYLYSSNESQSTINNGKKWFL